MSHKIGLISDKDSALLYKMLGFEIFIDHDPEAVDKKISEWAQDDYGVIYVTEAIAEKAAATIEKYQTSTTPAIILIPDHTGSKGIGKAQVQKHVEKAVGRNIL